MAPMDYTFHNAVIVRTPLLSFADYQLDNLKHLLTNIQLQQALYLANPEFYNLLAAKNFDFGLLSDKERFTLARYYNRLSFRSTPLGLFASFCIAEWGDDCSLNLTGNMDIKVHLLPDHKINYQLSISTLVINLLNATYLTNACLYRAYQEYRFIKTTAANEGDRMTFAIESLKRNVFTNSLLNYCENQPRKGESIVLFTINKTGCEHDEAVDYLQFLVQSQILWSTESLNITGDDYFFRTAKKQSALANDTNGLKAIADSLHDIRPSTNRLQSIQQQLKKIAGLNDNKSAFYTVSERNVLNGNIDSNTQLQITQALNALAKLSIKTTPAGDLHNFIKEFKKRYEGQKVPLLHAVDPEIGIGYSDIKRNDNELLPDDAWLKNERTNTARQLQWTLQHQLLMRLWCMRDAGDIYCPILLTDDDISRMEQDDSAGNYPPSLSVIFRKADEKTIIESTGGVSAIPLIGRFSLFNKQVEQLCRDVATAEQQANPSVLFAELIQISDLHVDNVNRRRFIYDYEIPINAVSLKPAHQQIKLSDLWLSVVNDELILESFSLKKRIIPRHSTAYNTNNNNLGVFKLLTDMQGQGLLTNMYFSLDSLFPGLEFYPRVEYNNIVLSPAKWNLGTKFIEQLKTCAGITDELALFATLQKKWHLPQYLALNKSDQFLVFNTAIADEMQFLLNSIKAVKSLRLQEYITEQTPTVYAGAKPLGAQYIAFMYQKQPVYCHVGNSEASLYHLKRKFIPGSEWLYLKIYCNETFINQLLGREVLPLIRQLTREGILTTWFFVRYYEAGSHLRLRMHLRDNADSGAVLKMFNNRLNDIVHYRLIKEYMADSYQPELERYGADMMLLTEKVFHASSLLVTEFIARCNGQSNHFTFYSFAMVTVNDMASAFLFNLADKITFFKKMSDTFYTEFASDKHLRVEMDANYRNSKEHFISAFANYNQFKNIQLSKHYAAFKSANKALSEALMAAASARRHQMLADVIHMHINRIFATNQRRQELLVYYYLYKYMLYLKSVQNATV